MFSANITGQIQRVVYDNKKSGADAMIKVALAVPKQYVPKDSDQSHIFPLITIFGHDASYLRKYAGKGQIITAINAEADYFKNEKFEDEKGNNPDTVSFTTRKVAFQKKAVMDALLDAGVAEEADGDEEEEDDRSSRRGKRGSGSGSSKGGSRSSRRGESTGRKGRGRDEEDEDEDDDDEEEEEAPPKRRGSSRSSGRTSSKSSSSRGGRAKPSSRKRDDDEDYDDDDDYFDEDED